MTSDERAEALLQGYALTAVGLQDEIQIVRMLGKSGVKYVNERASCENAPSRHFAHRVTNTLRIHTHSHETLLTIVKRSFHPMQRNACDVRNERVRNKHNKSS